jgi:chromosome partitioning protein
MLTIAVLHLKGGSGKTTLAINLAAAAHLDGHCTRIIDMDPLATAFEWSAQRPAGSKLEGIHVKRVPLLARDSYLEMSANYDVVLLDAPAHRRDIALRAAIFADVVLVPVTPGPADYWSINNIRDVINEADQWRADSKVEPVRRAFVVNRAVAGQLLTADAVRGIKALADAELAGTVRLRVAFPTALAAGESVLTIPGAASAATDIERLWRALQRGPNAHPRKAKPRRIPKAQASSHRQARGERDAAAR